MPGARSNYHHFVDIDAESSFCQMLKMTAVKFTMLKWQATQTLETLRLDFVVTSI
jgi:hypothetical protein